MADKPLRDIQVTCGGADPAASATSSFAPSRADAGDFLDRGQQTSPSSRVPLFIETGAGRSPSALDRIGNGRKRSAVRRAFLRGTARRAAWTAAY